MWPFCDNDKQVGFAITSQSRASDFTLDVQFIDVANTVPFKHRYALERHFARHGQEFGVATADEYEQRADAFMMGPLRAGALECARDGDLVRFDPGTDEFGVLTKDGHIATFMIVKPLPNSRQTSLQYFQSNCK